MTTPTTLPPVTPLACTRELSFSEFNRVISDLMSRDRALEQAFFAFANAATLQNISDTITALQIIIGQDLIDSVVTAGALPIGTDDFEALQNNAYTDIAQLESDTTVTDGTNAPLSLKSVVAGLTNTMASFNTLLTTFQTQIAGVVAATASITSVTAQITALSARVTTLESLTADLSAEVTNARAEFATDPSKRLIDKINAMDSVSTAIQARVTALTQEITDARSADRYDTLAEHLGAIESSIEALNSLLATLQGAGTVTSIRIGRNLLHGDVELIPGSNVALTRERNGFRVDVVGNGTVLDLSAPVIDPNTCCGPNG